MTRTALPTAVLAFWAVLAAAGPWLPIEPDGVDLTRVLAGPQAGGWLGFDDLGRPVLDRLAAGARVSFAVAVLSVGLSALLGSVLGTLAAWLGGLWDRLAVRVMDTVLAVPGTLLAIALAGVLGPGVDNVVVALAAAGWVGFARLARAQTLSLRRRDHVLAAVALGAGTGRIVLRHLLPLMTAPLVVEATFALAGAVIAEASLSFLGLGVQPPTASWGSMIRDGTRYMLLAPHLLLAPSVALLLVVLAVNLLGDRLRDRLDVRGRARVTAAGPPARPARQPPAEPPP